MKSQLISPDQWHTFFRDFSRIHAGSLITINVSGPELFTGDEVIDHPFRGISRDGSEIFVHVGGGSKRTHLERRVREVDTIRLQQTDEGADAAVAITSIDGSQTTVRFRSPVLPEMLDRAVE